MHPEHRSFIDRVREENERDFGPGPRLAVQRLLDAGLPHPWTYVFELTQNARDAGARRIWWHADGHAVVFQHDGSDPLCEKHVRALASVGGSTKGLTSIGFMGVGFKAVFARFRVARVSGSGWRFRFDVEDQRGILGVTIPDWLDTLRPRWDEDGVHPSAGYTTLFRLEAPARPEQSPALDFARLASLDDPTPLAVLALRGIEQVRVGEATWGLSVADDVVEVLPPGRAIAFRWKAFRSRFRPDDAAMRRFLEVRRVLNDDLDERGLRNEREVVALLPLNPEGVPDPPELGRVYATLPTQVRIPFGFHLQADWLVNVDRQDLRDVEGDPWQEQIVRQVPVLVLQLLTWLAHGSEEVRRRGYAALEDPRGHNGPFARPFSALRDAMIATLARESLVPLLGIGCRRFCVPAEASRLPGRFLTHFGSHPTWRADALFPHPIMDEHVLGERGKGFANWLDWGRLLTLEIANWPSSLPTWWNELAESDQFEALMALWECVHEQGWHDAPVVPTEAGQWIGAGVSRWLTEAPPSDSEPSGRVIAQALANALPGPHERIPDRYRDRVEKWKGPGALWLKSHHVEVTLAGVVQRVFNASAPTKELPLVELLEWAMGRNERRQDLVPLVLTEAGPRPANAALVADPLVERGQYRRGVFPHLSPLVEEYALINEGAAVELFLRRLGVEGEGRLVERSTHAWSPDEVARALQIERSRVKKATRGYAIKDLHFPFDAMKVDAEALQEWLVREHHRLRQCMSRRWADSSHYSQQRTEGERPCDWVASLQKRAWILCRDGTRRMPEEVLCEPDPDFEDATIADLDAGLAKWLKEKGVRFGAAIPKSPALRRLARKGSTDIPDSALADLISEAQQQVQAGEATEEDFAHALNSIRVRGSFPLNRLVERTGTGSGVRSDLGSWVLALPDVDSRLASKLREVFKGIPTTTSGLQAIAFLKNTWADPPGSVEELRRHLAAAYRYVLDDAASNLALAHAWREARPQVRLYGGRRWHALGPNLLVEDVQSPRIRRLLPIDRVAVASAHLGDSAEQIRRVAVSLGLKLLSQEVSVECGPIATEPPYEARVRHLLGLLSTLSDRRPIKAVSFRANVLLRVGGIRQAVSAYIQHDELLLVGVPTQFGAEAAEQLVGHFQLSQQGDVVPWLTVALLTIDAPDAFAENLTVLADGLGVQSAGECPPLKVLAQASVERENGPPEDEAPATPPAPAPRTAHQGLATGPDSDGPKNGTPPPAGSERSDDDTPRRVGVPEGSGDVVDRDPTSLVVHTAGEAPTMGESRETNTECGDSTPRQRAPRRGRLRSYVVQDPTPSDEPPDSPLAVRRRALEDAGIAVVVRFERAEGRDPLVMDEGHPGYDIESRNRAGATVRFIEVKARSGAWGEDGVGLTKTEFATARDYAERYWLYVVEHAESAEPCIHRIQDPARRVDQYFFDAGWEAAAESRGGV